MKNENLRYRRLSTDQTAVGEVVEGIAIKVDGRFFRRRATVVATIDAATGEEQPLPEAIGTTLAIDNVTRRDIADVAVKRLGPGYRRGNAIKRGVFELIRDTGKTLVAEGWQEDGKVSLVGSDGIEIDSTTTLRPTRWGELRVARRRLQSDGAGNLSFAKKK